MGIPILSDIVDFFKKAIDWAFKLMPKPLLFMVFFLLLTLIGGFILPFFFNVTGTFCVDDVKLSGNSFNFPKNVATYFNYNTNRNYSSVEFSCSQEFLDVDHSEFFYDGQFCTDCDVIDSSSHPSYLINNNNGTLGFRNNLGLCAGNAYRIADENKSTIQKLLCESKGDTDWYAFGCEPPIGFYYNRTSNTYICEEDFCLTINSTKLTIESLTAAGYYRTSGATDNVDIIGIKCFDDKPKLAFVGIDVFDVRIWLILLFIMLLWYAYTKFW